MKVKCVPAIVTLSAGLVNCIVSIYYHLDTYTYLKQLLFVLILFYFVGCILQWILDFGIKKMADKKENMDKKQENKENDNDNENENEALNEEAE